MSKQPLIDQLDRAISRILANPEAKPETPDAEIAELLRIAQDLRTLPSPGFKASLKTEMERNTQMSAKTVVFRAGFRTVTPYLLPPGPEYVDFLKNVFGAEETERTPTGPGRFHAEFRIGDSMLMLGVGSGMTMPTALELYVPDVDELFKRAIDAGCKELEAVYDAHWEGGLRLGTLLDPAGNAWVIATHRGSGNYIPEGRNSLSASLVAAGATRLVDFMKQAFDAKELQRYEWQGGLYASIRVGDSVMGVSEAGNHEWMHPMPSMIYMYVPDCDALYQQALRAGATSLSTPANQSYGDRTAGVKDAWGNIWYLATPQ
jgi:PhnB protein